MLYAYCVLPSMLVANVIIKDYSEYIFFLKDSTMYMYIVDVLAAYLPTGVYILYLIGKLTRSCLNCNIYCLQYIYKYIYNKTKLNISNV